MFLDGLHLKSARAMAGMSQHDLAEAAGLHVNSVKYWENTLSRRLDGRAVEQMRDALAAVGVIVLVEEERGPAGIVRFDQI